MKERGLSERLAKAFVALIVALVYGGLVALAGGPAWAALATALIIYQVICNGR